jgi:hypothetical protein
MVLARTDEDAYKSFRNLPGIQLMLVSEINAYDILCNDWIVFTRQTLPGVTTEDDTAASQRAEGPPATVEAAAPTDSDIAESMAGAEPERTDTESADTESVDAEDAAAGNQGAFAQEQEGDDE